MRVLLLSTLILVSQLLIAQKKVLDHDDFDRWNNITESSISPNGQFVVYHLTPGKGDATMKITTNTGKELASISRGVNSTITWDSRFVVFTIKPQLDTLNNMRRNKVKEDKLPKDTLAIYDLKNKTLVKLPRVKSYKIPKEHAGLLTYLLEPELPQKIKKDTVKTDSLKSKKKAKPVKKVGKDNGHHLVIYQLETKQTDTLFYVKDYALAKSSDKFIFHTSGKDSTVREGIYYYNLATKSIRPLCRSKGKFAQLAMSEDGLQAAFLSDLDTTKTLIRDYHLRYWNPSKDSALTVAHKDTKGIPANWLVNENGKVNFSQSGARLFFGTSPEPVVQDTMLLPEEIVQVEIWNYKNGRLHTQQNIEAEADKKRSYLAYFNTTDENIVQLGSIDIPEVRLANHGDSEFAMGQSNIPYQKYVTWEGYPQRFDFYSINTKTGEATLAIKDLRGSGDISAEGQYLYWYNAEDTTWYSFDNANKQSYMLTKGLKVSMADEQNDQPNYPQQYGSAGWTTGDSEFLVYDRYDIWKIDPKNGKEPQNITNGRAAKLIHRIIDLDRDEEAINTDLMLVHLFREGDKKAGFATMQNLGKPKSIMLENAMFSSVIKAEKENTIIYRSGNQQKYHNLFGADLNFKKIVQLSDANPQQSQYNWATVELYNWISLDGEELEGLLYKPENFDPNKKYPMITYFYERYSDNLNRHWGAVPIRSIINPTFYASRGYVVFIPDITYKIGYPGESCYNAVIPGVTSLIEKGFIDKSKLGVQGHSWGGYQVAYLVTKTDIFAAAEAGAIVANMISAYGGIRWWTGLSRMFQYEHTQSRIGGTLWEYPIRYIENSPIFFADKVKTPLLLMHNDADGHVPWYQGIEFYTALRRLNKPVWMLNYNGEPHWPTKWENIRDFNIRMSQFFDHYLKEAPEPIWMENGIPAVEKGINRGLELSED